MAVDFARFREFVSCRTSVNVAGAAIPSIATDARGIQATVPAGEVWYLAQMEYVNTSASSSDVYVWIVPPGEAISSTETEWLWVPGVSIAAETSATVEMVQDVPLRRMTEGQTIWIMGGGDDVNVIVTGWRYAQ